MPRGGGGDSNGDACDTACIVGSIIGGIVALLVIVAAAYYALKRVVIAEGYPDIEMQSTTTRNRPPIESTARNRPPIESSIKQTSVPINRTRIRQTNRPTQLPPLRTTITQPPPNTLANERNVKLMRKGPPA